MDYKSRRSDEVVVFSSTDPLLIDTCSLVLDARDIDHWIEREAGGIEVIVVACAAAPAATEEIDRYFAENRDWPPAPAAAGKPLSPAPPTIILIGAMAVFYLITGPFDPASPWFSGGAGDSTLILRQGQYHRLVTALTLHADFAHMAGNCLIGGFLMHFFLQLNGTGFGLLLVLAAATAGNHANVLIHGPGHVFVGFSTAVFAIIGMLATQQIVEQRRPPGIRMLVPFMAGAALLAMLGSSGVRTDLGAHLFGLLSGLAFGIPLGTDSIGRLRRSTFVQNCALVGALFVLLASWNMALAAAHP